MTGKRYIRGLTNSGDFYSATEEQWKEYWKAVESDNWDAVLEFETSQRPDFKYDP